MARRGASRTVRFNNVASFFYLYSNAAYLTRARPKGAPRRGRLCTPRLFNMSLAPVYLLKPTRRLLMEARAQAASFPAHCAGASPWRPVRRQPRSTSYCAPRLPHEGPCASSLALRVACVAQSAAPPTRPLLAGGRGTQSSALCVAMPKYLAMLVQATALLVDLRLERGSGGAEASNDASTSHRIARIHVLAQRARRRVLIFYSAAAGASGRMAVGLPRPEPLRGHRLRQPSAYRY
jgi:hypothetical protein